MTGYIKIRRKPKFIAKRVDGYLADEPAPEKDVVYTVEKGHYYLALDSKRDRVQVLRFDGDFVGQRPIFQVEVGTVTPGPCQLVLIADLGEERP